MHSSPSTIMTELRTKPSVLPVDTPQPQAVADGVSGLTLCEKDSGSQKSMDKGAPIIMDGSKKVSNAENNDIQIEIDSLFDETDDIFKPKNTLMTEVDDIFAEADAESKVGGAEIQDSDADFGTDDIESRMRDIETIHHPLKRKPKTGRQGSKDNPLVIPDSDTKSESDSESQDGFLWKKRRVSHSLVERRQVRSWRRMIDETDDEANETETMDKAIPRTAASSTRHSDFNSTLFKSADCIESQSVARVGGNGEWGIHGIIGKEVIEGKVYYCVDWEPTMMPLDELWGAERLVREFEAKEQAQQRKMCRTQKKKHRGRHRKQK
ncbi:MAG: hypothetical protein M1839_003235 [Geoglossum umbratile]|nr:MAG: hypothetical protein M1839_003235 [Geoglossum umbratile]